MLLIMGVEKVLNNKKNTLRSGSEESNTCETPSHNRLLMLSCSSKWFGRVEQHRQAVVLRVFTWVRCGSTLPNRFELHDNRSKQLCESVSHVLGWFDSSEPLRNTQTLSQVVRKELNHTATGILWISCVCVLCLIKKSHTCCSLTTSIHVP